MQAPQIIVSDLDGTLLTPDGKLTVRTREALRRVLAQQAMFVIATGRVPGALASVHELDEFPILTVCANGAVVYDLAADQVLYVETIDSDLLRMLVATCVRLIPGCTFGVERVAVGSCAADRLLLTEYGFEHRWSECEERRIPREHLAAEPSVKLLVRHSEMSSDDMAAVLDGPNGPHGPLHGRAAVTFSTNDGLLEITPLGVDKASGVEWIAGRAVVRPTTAVAFGDMPNDIPLLRWAGHGVAMANAHRSLVAVADEVTTSNADDGVARVLERWFRA
jgi:Cof subfamily protein (haloacid dehalogenase superfamily)